MIAGRAYCDALDRLNVVRQLDELHCVSLAVLLNDGFADGVDDLGTSFLFNDANLIFGVEGEVGAKSVVEIEIHFLFLFLHLNIEVVYYYTKLIISHFFYEE